MKGVGWVAIPVDGGSPAQQASECEAGRTRGVYVTYLPGRCRSNKGDGAIGQADVNPKKWLSPTFSNSMGSS